MLGYLRNVVGIESENEDSTLSTETRGNVYGNIEEKVI